MIGIHPRTWGRVRLELLGGIAVHANETFSYYDADDPGKYKVLNFAAPDLGAVFGANAELLPVMWPSCRWSATTAGTIRDRPCHVRRRHALSLLIRRPLARRSRGEGGSRGEGRSWRVGRRPLISTRPLRPLETSTSFDAVTITPSTSGNFSISAMPADGPMMNTPVDNVRRGCAPGDNGDAAAAAGGHATIGIDQVVIADAVLDERAFVIPEC